jgi:predicted transcriptional regulator
MRRSRIDIVVEVLEVAKNGVNKTAIVYRTNLNFRLADKYIELLENQGLLENKLSKYITTDRGRIFLGKAKELTLQLEIPIQKAKEINPHPEIPLHKAEEINSQLGAQMIQSKEPFPWLKVSMRKSKERTLHSEDPILAV